MNRFQNTHAGTNRTPQPAVRRGKQYWLAAPIVVTASIVIFTAQAQSPLRRSLIPPASDAPLAGHAKARAASPAPGNEDLRLVDTLKLKAKGLLPNTAFAVFLTGVSEPAVRAGDYLGELKTNADGRGSMHADAIIDAAVSRTRDDDGMHPHAYPNRVILRFANPKGDDICFAPATGPTDGTALSLRNVPREHTASIATTRITEARSIDDEASLFQTIHWRFVRCVSVF